MNTALRQLLFFVVLLALPIASYFLVFKPQNVEIEKARKEIDHKQSMLDKLRLATAQSDDLARANDQVKQARGKIASEKTTALACGVGRIKQSFLHHCFLENLINNTGLNSCLLISLVDA